jgi:hypothetical protein
MGDNETATIRCHQAITAAMSLNDSDRLCLEAFEWSIRANMAAGRGATDEAAQFMERAAEASRASQRPAKVALSLGSAATYHVMAGDTKAAMPLASEGLALARRVQMPSLIVHDLVALAGALVDDDPEQARALLKESMHLLNSLGYQNWSEVIQTALISARLGEWSHTLTLAGPAIRHLHWAGDRPLLGAILNLVAHALAPTTPHTAAVLQGAARTLVISTASPVVGGSTDEVHPRAATSASSNHYDFVTELRRSTTALSVLPGHGVSVPSPTM